MLPLPFEKYVLELLKVNLSSDSGGTALVNKADTHIQEWEDDALEVYWVKVAERCPSGLLDELGDYLAADLFAFDTDRQKRQKIKGAIERHKVRSTWEGDAKVIVDAICGNSSSLVTDYFAEQWLLWAKEASDPSDYTATLGDDGIDNELGIDLVGSGTECVIEGIVCIDCDSDISTQVAKTDFITNNSIIQYRSSGVLSNGNFVFLYEEVLRNSYFQIRTQEGVVVVAATQVLAGVMTGASLCVLEDDSFVISYGDSTAGGQQRFQIFDNTGSQISSGTISGNSCIDSSSSRVEGQYWVSTYYNTGTVRGRYAVYQDDTLIVEGNIGTGQISSPQVDRYDSNKFIVVFQDVADANRGKFTVIDITGAVIFAETTFSSNAVLYPSVSVLDESTNLWAVSYYDATSTDGKFILYRKNSVFLAETIFTSNVITLVESIKLNNENLIIAYYDSTSTDGKFIVYSKEGDLFKRETVFLTDVCTGVSLTMLNNGNFVILYTDSTNIEGAFIIKNEGLGFIDISNLVESLETDVSPAYMRVQLVYSDPDTGFMEIYPNGVMG